MDNRLKDWIEASNEIVFFGGAGTSTESEIPDFRSQKGLYSCKYGDYSPEMILSHSFFIRHPDVFYKFCREKIFFVEAKPNKTHFALAKLEKEGRLSAVITQNIDGLHQLGGSRNVLELHGTIHKNYCMNCGKSYDLNYVADIRNAVPVCEACGGIVRPDVILYEEALNMNVFEAAAEHIRKADLLIVGGTSLLVYPAAGLVAELGKGKLVLINKQSTPCDDKADLLIHESIGYTLQHAIFGGKANETGQPEIFNPIYERSEG